MAEHERDAAPESARTPGPTPSPEVKTGGVIPEVSRLTEVVDTLAALGEERDQLICTLHARGWGARRLAPLLGVTASAAGQKLRRLARDSAEPVTMSKRSDVLPASHEPQVQPHDPGEACWCEPILTDERTYHRSISPG